MPGSGKRWLSTDKEEKGRGASLIDRILIAGLPVQAIPTFKEFSLDIHSLSLLALFSLYGIQPSSVESSICEKAPIVRKVLDKEVAFGIKECEFFYNQK